MSESTYRITDVYAYTEADGEDVGYVELCCQVWEAAAAGAMLYQEVRLVPVEKETVAPPELPPGVQSVLVPLGGIVLDAAGVEAVRWLLIDVGFAGILRCRGCAAGENEPHGEECPVARVAALLPPKPEGT